MPAPCFYWCSQSFGGDFSGSFLQVQSSPKEQPLLRSLFRRSPTAIPAKQAERIIMAIMDDIGIV